MQSLQHFPNLKEIKRMKENVHKSIIHSNIYISSQRNYKQPNQLKSNNIHTKKEPHVMIMLLFKSHLSKSRGFFFSLSPFCEYHHQLETIGASASQEYIVLNKSFLQKRRQRRQNFANKIRILLVQNLDWKQIMPSKTLDVQNLNPFRNTKRKKKKKGTLLEHLGHVQPLYP